MGKERVDGVKPYESSRVWFTGQKTLEKLAPLFRDLATKSENSNKLIMSRTAALQWDARNKKKMVLNTLLEKFGYRAKVWWVRWLSTNEASPVFCKRTIRAFYLLFVKVPSLGMTQRFDTSRSSSGVEESTFGKESGRKGYGCCQNIDICRIKNYF